MIIGLEVTRALKCHARLGRWGKVRRAFIGAGMVPRGEVGLIFASVGLSSGALSESVFVSVLVAVFLTTFVAPPLLKLLRPRAAQARAS